MELRSCRVGERDARPELVPVLARQEQRRSEPPGTPALAEKPMLERSLAAAQPSVSVAPPVLVEMPVSVAPPVLAEMSVPVATPVSVPPPEGSLAELAP